MTFEEKKQLATLYIEAENKERASQGMRALTDGEEDMIFNAYISGCGIQDNELEMVTQMRDYIGERYVWLYNHSPRWLRWWMKKTFKNK